MSLLTYLGCPGEGDDDTAAADDDTTAGDDDTTTSDDDDSGLADCVYYRDADADGYGDPGDEVLDSCDGPPEGYVDDDQDCDDTDASMHPDAEELCDGRDNDCDGSPNPDEVDADGDGVLVCGGDCDDADASVYAGAQEVCNQVDEDCDGIVDEDTACYDDDGDGYSELDGDCDDADPLLTPDDADADGWSSCEGDCDDADPLTNPWAAELCNGLDDDCNGAADDDCEACTVAVPGDHPTIQEAIDAAAGGDAICVDPGTYTENLDFLGASVSVLGVGGPYQTIVQGTYGSVVSFVTGEDASAKLQGFTVTRGHGPYGTHDAGGINVVGADPVLRRLVVEDNGSEGGYGAGMVIDDGAAPQLTEVVVRDNLITAFAARGGGIYVSDSSPTFSRLLVQDNDIDDADYAYGTGMYIDGSTCEFTDALILDGVYLTGADVVLERVRVGGEEGGSGIEASGSTITGSNVRFADNSTNGLEVYVSEVTLDAFTFVGNGHPAWDYGTGLYDRGGSTVTLTNGVFRDNWTALEGEGATSWTLTNVVVDHHDEFGVWMDTGTATFSHCVFWNNGTDFAGIPSPVGADGNVSLNPEFLDDTTNNPFAWDLHLTGPSPLVDAGDATVIDPDGSVSDIGAYGGPYAGGWDFDGDGYFEWWQPGIYDFGVYPGQGWDCDDSDAAVYPGSGC